MFSKKRKVYAQMNSQDTSCNKGADSDTAVMVTQRQIALVDLKSVPVVATERSMPRKEQARLARQLFKKLGIKGVSFTTPQHSMASMVDVSVPRREDYTI